MYGNGMFRGSSEIEVASKEIEGAGRVRDKGTYGTENGGETWRLPRRDKMEVGDAKLTEWSGDGGNKDTTRRGSGKSDAGIT